MQKTIKDFSDVELKAMAYDCIAKKEVEERNLQIINNELASRAQKAQRKNNMPEEEVKVEETVETPVEETVSEETTEDTA